MTEKMTKEQIDNFFEDWDSFVVAITQAVTTNMSGEYEKIHKEFYEK